MGGGVFFLGAGGVPATLCFHWVFRPPPCRQPTTERPRLPSLLSEELRHTGAGGLLGSSAVGDDLPVRRYALEVLQDFRDRPSRLDRPDDWFGRESDRAGDSMDDGRVDERTGHVDGDRFAGVEL